MFFLLALGACTRTEPTAAALPRPTLWTPARASAAWVPARTRDLGAEAAGLAPDGTTVYEAAGDVLVATGTDGAERARWPLALGARAVDVGVSPDGTRIAVTTMRGNVAVVSSRSSEPPRVLHVVDPPRSGQHGEGGFKAEEVAVGDDGTVRLRNWDGWYACSAGEAGAARREDWGARSARSEAAQRPVPAAGSSLLPGGGLLALGAGRASWLAAGLRNVTAAERSTDGRWLLARSGTGLNARSHLRGPLDPAEVAPGPPVPVERGEGASRTTGLLALHPAGRWLAAGHGAAAAVWDLTTGEPRWLDLPAGYAPRALAWSPTGDVLAVLSAARGPDRLPPVLQVHDVDATGAPAATPRSSRRPLHFSSEADRTALAVTSKGDAFVATAGRAGTLVHASASGAGDAWSADRGARFPPAVALSPDGAWVAWRAAADRVEVRATAAPDTVTHTVTLGAAKSDVLLGLADGKLVVRSDEERVVLDLADGTATREARRGRRGADRGKVRAHLAAADLGRPLRTLATDALRLTLGYAGSEATDPVASADGTFAWADDDGRVWVATDDGAGPRLLTGPALTPARVSFVGERVQVWRRYAGAVATFPLEGGPATVSTQEEARAAGGATGPKWASIPGEMSWLGSTPDGAVGAYADAAGVVYLHRAGETDPFRALLTWPEGLP